MVIVDDNELGWWHRQSYSCTVNTTLGHYGYGRGGASVVVVQGASTLSHVTFWTSLSLRPKTETKRLKFGFSPEFGLTNHCIAHHCSLHNVIADVIADMSVFLCLFNLFCACKINRWVNYLWFSDRSVRSLVSAKRSANRWVQTKKNDFTFWLIFGLSPNSGLSDCDDNDADDENDLLLWILKITNEISKEIYKCNVRIT